MVGRKCLQRGALALVVVWCLLVTAFLLFQGAVLYPFDTRGVFSKPPKGFEAAIVQDGAFVEVRAARGGWEGEGVVRVWRAAAAHEPRGRILMLVGARGTPRTALSRAAPFIEHDWEVVIVIYPSAVGTPGEPSQAEMVRVASTVVDAFQSPPLIYGYSMGGALGVLLATEKPVAGLLLEAPLAEAWPLVRGHAPWLAPVPGVLRDRWEALAVAPQVSVPSWVIHGAQDDVVPVEQGRALARALGAGFHEVAGGGHRDLPKRGIIEGLSEVARAGQGGWWLAAKKAFPEVAVESFP